MPLKYSPEGQVIGCHADSVPEARLCIEELKRKKKELQAQREEITCVEHSRAANGDGQIRPSNGSISNGIIVTVDRNIAQFDKAIVGLERYVLSHSAKMESLPTQSPPAPPPQAPVQSSVSEPSGSEFPAAQPPEEPEPPREPGPPVEPVRARSATTKTYYEILDLPTSATEEEIKDSYRFHAAAWHPDKHVGANKVRAEAKMSDLNQAYRVLSNSQSRADYDRSLRRNKGSFAHSLDADMVQVPGTMIQLPVDVYDRVMHCLSIGQMTMASQELQNFMPGMPSARAHRIITRLLGRW
jgi:hypothetical protein